MSLRSVLHRIDDLEIEAENIQLIATVLHRIDDLEIECHYLQSQ
ncbi:Uncharacterised protein [Acinetobacter baumannii]|nr:hypothetical protein J602_1344 [Acinetobacter baumannii 1417041]SSU61345.1 Uncharacterised protein [Acinetobacter baumannii]